MKFRIGIGWGRLAEIVRNNPWRVLLIAVLLLVPPAVAAGRAHFSYNVLQELPPKADSVAGFDALSRHFDRGQVSPLMVVVEDDDTLWNDSDFRAINDLTVALGKLPGVARVQSVTQPTGGSFSEEDLAEAGVEDFASFPDRLQEGAHGVGQVIDGLRRIRGGLTGMRDRLPVLEQGLAEGAEGLEEIRAGITAMRGGISQMRDGLGEAAGALSVSGADNDLADQAGIAADRSKAAFDELRADPVASATHTTALRNIGETYARLTGADPENPNRPADDDAQTRRYFEAGGMEGSLRTIAAGLRRAGDGLSEIDGGLRQMDKGLGRLGGGLEEGSGAVGDVVGGASRMVSALDRIIPGLARLRIGLAEGAARVRQAGFGDAASAGNLGLTPGLIEAIPGMRERLSFFMSEDQKATRVLLTLEREPFAEESLDAARAARDAGAMALNNTTLEGTPIQVAGSSAFFNDIRALSRADFPIIMAAVLIGIFLVLVLLLRSIVAPVYMLLTVLLSFVSTLGLTVLAFQGIGGEPGLPWWLPSFLFVMLVALGADYNIFLMSRIREEARTHTTAAATARGLALTGHVITSAGLILAGTFAALLVAPLRSLQMFGFAVTVGILLDTFVVRSLLVPSIATILGRHNWWPSSRAHAR